MTTYLIVHSTTFAVHITESTQYVIRKLTEGDERAWQIDITRPDGVPSIGFEATLDPLPRDAVSSDLLVDGVPVDSRNIR